MKILTGLAMTVALSAQANLYQYQYNNVNANIPDGNLTGWSTFVSLGGMAPQITDVREAQHLGRL